MWTLWLKTDCERRVRPGHVPRLPQILQNREGLGQEDRHTEPRSHPLPPWHVFVVPGIEDCYFQIVPTSSCQTVSLLPRSPSAKEQWNLPAQWQSATTMSNLVFLWGIFLTGNIEGSVFPLGENKIIIKNNFNIFISENYLNQRKQWNKSS